MDIGWAVRALKDGAKVRRGHWPPLTGQCETLNLVSWVHLYLEHRDGHAPALMVLQSDGEARHFALTDLHLLGEDWELA